MYNLCYGGGGGGGLVDDNADMCGFKHDWGELLENCECVINDDTPGNCIEILEQYF